MSAESPTTTIHRLPDEILTSILSFTFWGDRPTDPAQEKSHAHLVATNLALTCHRFRRIARPFLFRYIKLDDTSSLRALHEALRKDPSVRLQCQHLMTFVVQREFWTLMNDIFKWLANVRKLNLYGFFESPPETGIGSSDPHLEGQIQNNNDDAWGLLQTASRHMKHLEILRCSHLWGSHLGTGYPMGTDFIECIDMPSLKELWIGRLGNQIVGPPIPGKERTGTGSFTTLTIWAEDVADETISQLISWPQALTEFQWHTASSLNPLPAIYSSLLAHRDTLKRIRFYEMPYYDAPPFNFASFPNLEHLHLCRSMMTATLNEEEQNVGFMLAPNLRRFTWDFDPGFGSQENWLDYGDPEETWLRVYAQAVIERGHPLREIEIRYKPHSVGRAGEGYPWDRMDSLRDEIRVFDVGLTYMEPIISKEDWLEKLRASGAENRRGPIDPVEE